MSDTITNQPASMKPFNAVVEEIHDGVAGFALYILTRPAGFYPTRDLAWAAFDKWAKDYEVESEHEREMMVNRCAVCGGLNPGDVTHTRCM